MVWCCARCERKNTTAMARAGHTLGDGGVRNDISENGLDARKADYSGFNDEQSEVVLERHTELERTAAGRDRKK